MKKLTKEYTKRVRSALKETECLLNKELSYSLDSQKHDRVVFLKGHCVKLINMLK